MNPLQAPFFLRLFVLLGFLATALLTSASPPSPPPERQGFEFSQPAMGTMVRITTYAPSAGLAEDAAEAAFARIQELNSILSDYDPDSELMRLARHPAGIPVPVSEDLFTILRRARKISELSDGAFDITVGAVGRLWREARKTKKLPDETAVQELLKATGYQKVALDPVRRTAVLQDSGMKLDLGGIAKGHAAEEALKVLRAMDLPQSLVAVSGDLAIGDPPPGRDGWRVGLSLIDPDRIEQAVTLRNVSVSTSGDTEQFVEIDGVRYSHILDPRTGIGLTRRIAVTVIAADGATADALATAASVLGEERGLALVESMEGAEALILIVTPEGTKAIPSSQFKTRTGLCSRPE